MGVFWQELHTDRSFHSTSAKSKSGNFTEGNEGNKDPETLRELRFLLSNLRVSVPSMQNQVCADSFPGIWHSRSLFASVSSPDPTGRKLHGRTGQPVLRGSRRESRHPKPHQANADGNRGELTPVTPGVAIILGFFRQALRNSSRPPRSVGDELPSSCPATGVRSKIGTGG